MKKKISVLLISIIAVFAFTACTQIQTVVSDANEDGNDVIYSVDYSQNESENGNDYIDSTVQNAEGDKVITYKYFGYVLYGQYPQTVADKKAVKEMSKTTDATGYYFSTYDNEHYAKITAANVYNMYSTKYEFMDETTINENETYYFKVEPLKWNVYGQLDVTSGRIQIYLLCDLIIDSMAFCDAYEQNLTDGEYYNAEGHLANNWAYSAVRSWLNKDFYDKAFNADEKAKIIARNTAEVCEEYNAEDATENVYCITYDQAITLGDECMAQVSDYARCRNTFIAVNDSVYGNGRWWLCSAGDKSYRVSYVSNYNKIVSHAGESAGSIFMGVRPAITLDVESSFEILQKEK